MTANTSSNAGALSIQSASGDLATLISADLGSAPTVQTDLTRALGSTEVRGVEWVKCGVFGASLKGPAGGYGGHGETRTADTDPSNTIPSSASYSRSSTLTDSIASGDAVDRLLVESAIGSQLDCAVDAAHTSDGLPRGTGTATGPSSLNFTQDITGAGLASNLLTIAALESTSSTQTLDHAAVSGAREIAATAGGSIGTTRILRIPATLEHGLVQLSPFNYSATAVASEATPSAAPTVTSSGGIGARLYDPAGVLPGCDSRSGEYCVKTIPVGGASGASGFSASVQGSVLRNSGLTELVFDYSINAFPPAVSPPGGALGPNGETLWNADYTAVSITARLTIKVTVNLLLTTAVVTLADSRVVGTLGIVSASGCAGVVCKDG